MTAIKPRFSILLERYNRVRYISYYIILFLPL